LSSSSLTTILHTEGRLQHLMLNGIHVSVRIHHHMCFVPVQTKPLFLWKALVLTWPVLVKVRIKRICYSESGGYCTFCFLWTRTV